MILSLTTIDLQMECRKFSCWLSDLGYALDVASQITNKSHKVLKVSITDEDGSRILFPIAIFDGGSFSVPMKQLETQWQAVLSEPVNQKSVHIQWLIGLAQQHITFQQTRIGDLEEAINRISLSWCPPKAMTAYSSRRVSHYVTQSDIYQRQLVQAQHCHATAISRLDELQSRL